MGLNILNENIVNSMLDSPCPLIVRQALARMISLRLCISEFLVRQNKEPLIVSVIAGTTEYSTQKVGWIDIIQQLVLLIENS